MIHLARAHASSQADTTESLTTRHILDYLDSVSDDTVKVSSRSIKAALTAIGGSSTWTRSIALASEYSNEWALVSQSFVRRDGAYYGFTVEASTADLTDAS